MENPWRNLPNTAPFVLKEDHPHVEKFNTTAKPDHYTLRLDAFPGPFMGNPEAPLVLLTLNPGFDEGDIVGDIKGMWRNIQTMRHEDMEYPFFLLDPSIKESPGYGWWYKRLRLLIEQYDVKFIANNLLNVEFFPYPSKHAAGFHREKLLPSQAYGFELVKKAMERKAVIIVFRAFRPWINAVPGLENYNRLYQLRSSQSTYITPNNCPDGYPEITKLLDALYKHST